MVDLLELMNKRYLAQAFAGFVGAVSSQKEGERKLAVMVQQHDMLLAFTTWRSWAESNAEERTLLLQAARRISNLKVAQVCFHCMVAAPADIQLK